MLAAQDWVNGSYPHRNLFDAAEASGLKIMHKLILEGAVPAALLALQLSLFLNQTAPPRAVWVCASGVKNATRRAG